MNLKDISKPISQELDDFNKYFKEVLNTKVSLLTLILKYITKKKGKQIRPVLVFLSAGITGNISARTNVGAAMVELLHTATLIHDDVVDRAKVRRGIASINSAWNNKVAVLVGDFLLSKGLQISVDHDEFDFLKVTSKAVQDMSEGELLGIEKARKLKTDEEIYYQIIKGKTASLISSCCEIGAISGSENANGREEMKLAGENLGMAFQIRDDLFDYISEPSLIGKPIGNDIREKKVTLPLLYALDKADSSDANKINKMIKSGKLDSNDIQYVINFVKSNGGVEYAQNKAQEFIKKTKENISKFESNIYKESFVNLADYVIERIS